MTVQRIPSDGSHSQQCDTPLCSISATPFILFYVILCPKTGISMYHGQADSALTTATAAATATAIVATVRLQLGPLLQQCFRLHGAVNNSAAGWEKIRNQKMIKFLILTIKQVHHQKQTLPGINKQQDTQIVLLTDHPTCIFKIQSVLLKQFRVHGPHSISGVHFSPLELASSADKWLSSRYWWILVSLMKTLAKAQRNNMESASCWQDQVAAKGAWLISLEKKAKEYPIQNE